VVIVTGYASLDSAIHAVRVGAHDYLAKPFSLSQLDAVLKRITDRLSLPRQARDPVRTSADTTEPPVNRVVPTSAALVALELGMERIEAAVARIERRLDAGAGSPFTRR
jgi:DNA-binding NtrC family response regulator